MPTREENTVAHSITEILRRAEEKANSLNSRNVEKARGVGNLLRIVCDLLRVLMLMQEKMSKLEAQVKELQDQLSSKEDRAG